MKKFKNILVVRTDRIGDVVLTTPSIEALRHSFPQAKISVLVTPETKDLIDDNPHLDHVIVDDRKGKHRKITGFLKLVESLKKAKFDLAIIYHTKKRTNLACYMAKIPYRIGYKNNKFGFLLTHPLVDNRHFGEKHETQYCLDVLKNLDIKTNDYKLHVSIKKEADQWADQFLRQNLIKNDDCLIAIHAGASDPSKCWPVKRFAELMDALSQQMDCKFVLIGTEETRTLSRKIMSLSSTRPFDLTGLTSVAQLVSLLKRCQLMVSNDSGPVHIAAALEVPVVSIFTRNQPGINPERWKPLGLKSKVVSIEPDNNISFKKAQSVNPKYLELIPTQAVLEAVDSIFKLC